MGHVLQDCLGGSPGPEDSASLVSSVATSLSPAFGAQDRTIRRKQQPEVWGRSCECLPAYLCLSGGCGQQERLMAGICLGTVCCTATL